MCRSRRELSNAYLRAKFGVDTAGNGALKVCQKLAKRWKTVRKKNIGQEQWASEREEQQEQPAECQGQGQASERTQLEGKEPCSRLVSRLAEKRRLRANEKSEKS